MSGTKAQALSPKKNACESRHIDSLREFLRCKGLGDDFIAEIIKCGLTDQIIRKLECRGFTFEDIVTVGKAFKEDSEDTCDCTFKSDQAPSTRTNHADFLIEHFDNILSKGLKEITMKKPFDPIEYLGHWLLYYRECEERERLRKEFLAELMEERLKYQKFAAVPEPPDEEHESMGECEKPEEAHEE